MRKWSMIIVALLLLTLWMAAPAAAQDDPLPPPDLSAVCHNAVTGMTALTANRRLPDHLMQDNPVKTANDFDVNAYFTVLDHLAVEDGYFLDYVYQYDFMGGHPVLYTLPDDQPPFETYADYMASLAPSERTQVSYLDRIVTDDTPEGYVQMVVLDVMGAQFYLHWHAGYNDFQVICDDHMLASLLAADNGFGDSIQQSARLLDVTPTVTLDEDVTHVEFTGFTKWGGFYRATLTVSRSYPREIYEGSAENVVEYDCGVMF
jgi:hypothetical protein